MAFFHILQQKKSANKKQISEQTIREFGCKVCTLDKIKSSNPKMPPAGSDKPIIYFIGGAPTDTDDEKGEHFRGGGSIVRSLLPSKLKAHSRWNNTIRCAKSLPTAHETACCRSLQEQDILKTRPQIIVGFGHTALNWFTGYSDMRAWAGRKMPLRIGDHSFWFYSMMNAATVAMQSENYGGAEQFYAFEFQMKRMFAEIDKGLKEPEVIQPENALDGVVTAEHMNVGQIADYLVKIIRRNRKSIGLDWETKGLRPYPTGNKILTAAIGTFAETFSFPIGHREANISERDQKMLLGLIGTELAECGKVWAHNAKFEQEWMINKISEAAARKIKWGDTMAQAYTLDERKGAKGLDEVVLINYGIRIKSLSKLDTKNLNNEPLPDVLRYGGMDTKFCEGVAKKQAATIFKEKLTSVSAMNQRRTLTMAVVQSKGVMPNRDEAKRMGDRIERDLKLIVSKVSEMQDVKDYERRYGQFNLLNINHASTMFKKHLGMFHLESVDESALSTVDHPLAELILEARGLDKLISTYINKIVSGEIVDPDGLIHAQFNNLVTSTGRLASDDPNMQNFPKRKGKYVRNSIGVPKNHFIVAFDMGQIEARMIGMMSRDKFLCKALWTGYDIHGHWTDKIGAVYPKWAGDLTDKTQRKTKRDRVKNEWVFPAFFGAQLNSVSGYLGIPATVLEPLYEEFWDQFSGVKDWQEDLLSFYKRNLYVETLTGRRRHGPMSPNELINSPVQGGASDITVDSMEYFVDQAYIREEPWLTPIMNVHDDLTFYLPNGSKGDDACEFIGKRMCLSPYDFINVPLIVEMSASNIGWGELEEVAIFQSTDYPEGKRYELNYKGK